MPPKDTTETFTVSIPSYLIEEMDLLCVKRDLNRSAFVKRALKKYIALHHADSDLFWTYLDECRMKSLENSHSEKQEL